MKLQKDLTTGKIPRQILSFFFPLILSDILLYLYNAVDMAFIGRFVDTESLAAVSVCGSIMTVVVIVLSGLSSAVSVVIASYKGKMDLNGTKRAGNTSCALYLTISIFVMLLGLVFTTEILQLVRTPAEALGQAKVYLRTIFCGITLQFGYSLICALQRGFGDSKSSLLFVVIAALTNIVLDYLFIVELHMGVFGAALATIIAQACSLLMGLVHFRHNKHVFSFRINEVRFHKNELREILRIGLPTAINEVFVNIAMLVVSTVGNSYGVVYSAAYGIGHKIDQFAVVSDGAMNNAMAVFASQNMGAGRPDRALSGLKYSALISVIVTMCIMPCIYILQPQIIRLFDNNPEVINAAVSYLRVTVFSYVLFALVGPLIGFMRGTGNQHISLAVGFIAQYIFRVPAALIVTHYMGFSGLGVAIMVGPLSSVVMYTIVVITGMWKRGTNTRKWFTTT